MSDGRWPASQRLAHAALLAWLVCLAVSWALYPGGSWADGDSTGFAPLTNYWCDLMARQAWNGTDNTVGSLWGQAAFCALGLAGLGVFLGVAPLVGRRPARRIAAGGLLACLATLAVALVPYQEHRTAHAVFSLLAGLGMAAATVEAVLRSWSAPAVGGLARAAGATFLLAGLANIVVYLPLVWAGGGNSVSMPVIQKLATVAFVLWVPAILAAARRVGEG